MKQEKPDYIIKVKQRTGVNKGSFTVEIYDGVMISVYETPKLASAQYKLGVRVRPKLVLIDNKIHDIYKGLKSDVLFEAYKKELDKMVSQNGIARNLKYEILKGGTKNGKTI